MKADDLIDAIERADRARPQASTVELLAHALRQMADEARAEAARCNAEADVLERIVEMILQEGRDAEA